MKTKHVILILAGLFLYFKWKAYKSSPAAAAAAKTPVKGFVANLLGITFGSLPTTITVTDPNTGATTTTTTDPGTGEVTTTVTDPTTGTTTTTTTNPTTGEEKKITVETPTNPTKPPITIFTETGSGGSASGTSESKPAITSSSTSSGSKSSKFTNTHFVKTPFRQ